MRLAENVVAANATQAVLAADVDKTAKMVDESSIHAYFGAQSPSGPQFVVH